MSIESAAAGRRVVRIVRPRTVLYVVMIAIVAAVMLYGLTTRHTEAVSVIHDRNPMFVRLSDGGLRNGFTVRILNMAREPRTFALATDGLADAHLEVVGSAAAPDGHPLVAIGPDQTRELRVLVTSYHALPRPPSVPLMFRITDAASGRTASVADNFRGP